MASDYSTNLLKRVVDSSNASNWDAAVDEWEITDWEEDEDAETSCICGKENIRYLYTITNTENGNVLKPIGSQCIKKFKRSTLNQKTALYESLFKLRRAIQSNKFIELKSTFFSRALLKYLDEQDVFKPNNFNKWDGHADYLFLLKMFNKRDKTSISNKQQRKITALILNDIFPYLQDNFKDK